MLQKHGISAWLPRVSNKRAFVEQIILVRIGQMVFDVGIEDQSRKHEQTN